MFLRVHAENERKGINRDLGKWCLDTELYPVITKTNVCSARPLPAHVSNKADKDANNVKASNKSSKPFQGGI